MKIGDLRHRVIIQKPGTVKNKCNEEVPGFIDFAAVWAAVNPMQGRELESAQKLYPEVQYKIKMRYRPGIKPDMIVVFGGRILDIKGVINPQELNKELHLLCIEKVKPDVRD